MKENKLSFISVSENQTIAFAQGLSGFLQGGDIIALCGELGSGKTTFVKGLAKGLDIRQKINSPSFVIMKIYKGRDFLFHFDLYRLRSIKDLESIGFDEFISSNAISVIEWADRAEDLLPKHYLRIKIGIGPAKNRKFECVPHGDRYVSLIKKIKKDRMN